MFLSTLFEIFGEYVKRYPDFRLVQEIVRDGVFMYRHKEPRSVNRQLLEKWFQYAHFTYQYVCKFHLPSFHVFRCMHHIRHLQEIRHELPFSTSWNIEVALDWYTPSSTILVFEVSNLHFTYIDSDEDELVIEPSILIKQTTVNTDIEIVWCTCIPLREHCLL